MVASQIQSVAEVLHQQGKALARVAELDHHRKESNRREVVRLRDLLGERMGKPTVDEADVETVAHALQPPLHELVAQPHAAAVRVHRQATELTHQIGQGTDLEHHRSGAEHPPTVGVFGHKHQRFVAEDQLLEELLVVELGEGVVVAIAGVEDLGDRGSIIFARLADIDHLSSPPRRPT